MKLREKTYLIYVNSSIIYWKFIIKVNNQLIWFLLILKIDWVNITKLYCLQQGKLTKVWDPQHLFPRHIIWISYIFFEKPYQCVFQMFLDFDWQFLHVRKVLLCYKTITIKDAILHFKKIMLFLLPTLKKEKLGQKIRWEENVQ